MEVTGQDNTPPAGTDYAATHCRRCVMGWTRIGKAGGVRTVCLLDRDLVLADMTSCDRYAGFANVRTPIPLISGQRFQ